jgi:sec-independent protein translocase protein TatA
MILIAAIGLLVFGNRLPDVGRSLGRGIVEFKKGLRGIKDEIDEAETKEDDTTK